VVDVEEDRPTPVATVAGHRRLTTQPGTGVGGGLKSTAAGPFLRQHPAPAGDGDDRGRTRIPVNIGLQGLLAGAAKSPTVRRDRQRRGRGHKAIGRRRPRLRTHRCGSCLCPNG
jgi:hypothetical protein